MKGQYHDSGNLSIVLLLVIVALVIASPFVSVGIPSEGTATDSIARISKGGLIWQTWKVQLTNDHPTSNNPMQYGVENDPQLIEDLQHYAETGERVKISYTGKLFIFGWEYSDNEVIIGVVPA